MNRTLLLWCAAFLLCFATTARAADTTAASCAAAAVQNAINVASDGDTVTVPAGNCTWTTMVSISNKGLTLHGAGIGQTTITDQASGVSALSITGATTTKFVDISGFTWVKAAAHPHGIVRIEGEPFTVAFRFHHNRILQQTSGSRGIVTVGVYGLIDHNIIDVPAKSGSIQSISIFGTNPNSDGGFSAWAQPLTLGTNRAVYVEDNPITYDVADTGVEDALDAYAGARLVVRYNLINNIAMGMHGFDSGGFRSPVSFEVYRNNFINNSTKKIRGWTVRGGTGVFFNNKYGGTVPTGWYGITLMYYRACGGGPYAWGKCDGTKLKLVSNDPNSNGSRQATTAGTFGFDSRALDALPICSHGVGSCTAFLDGEGAGGYPGRDQPGRGPGQVLEPIYIWNIWNDKNMTIGASNGGDPSNCNGLGIENYIREGRDFIDNGTVPKPGYTPYVYPHPLQTMQGNTDAPNAPTDLIVR